MGLFDFFGDNGSNDSLKPYVDRAISTFESGNIAQLQNDLYQLVSLLNKPGSGSLITGFTQKDRLCEVFNLCLQFDWMHDPDIREVWAENAFYCIASYFKQAKSTQDYMAASLDLFLTCYYGKESLRTKFNDILRKARIHPLHNKIFTSDEYDGGSDYLIREFSFFSATVLSPLVKSYPSIISPQVRVAFDRSKSDFVFATISPEEIIKKMSFIASIIESIINDI